ncbi:sensor histidine kinase [Paenibacillus athensensis]|uniref:histidine kinase n=1 Tax=Paenibacillus athensensis TaxID=1967502 RepID=A0A4Y8PZI9_9BACL|nr:histidine kinase [Paenibacillus athensensis]MCD1261233.1 sensor histidine kinase [Paenibacillus athensensis]
MTYKQIKWLILIIPPLTLMAWEYARHHLFMDYMSMEVGNWLAPLIVLAVSITFLRRLFTMLEATQEELNRERFAQIASKEREKIARELHDGIAQSLFLMSIRMDQLEQTEQAAATGELRQTVHQVNEYVRQAISNLRYPTDPAALPWMQYLESMVADLSRESGLAAEWDWQLTEEQLTAKEKVELYASIREALLNVRKHAKAQHVWIRSSEQPGGWTCSVIDDGQGAEEPREEQSGRYGLKIMRERAAEMGWQLRFGRDDGKTILEIRKEGG